MTCCFPIEWDYRQKICLSVLRLSDNLFQINVTTPLVSTELQGIISIAGTSWGFTIPVGQTSTTVTFPSGVTQDTRAVISVGKHEYHVAIVPVDAPMVATPTVTGNLTRTSQDEYVLRVDLSNLASSGDEIQFQIMDTTGTILYTSINPVLYTGQQVIVVPSNNVVASAAGNGGGGGGARFSFKDVIGTIYVLSPTKKVQLFGVVPTFPVFA